MYVLYCVFDSLELHISIFIRKRESDQVKEKDWGRRKIKTKDKEIEKRGKESRKKERERLKRGNK